MLGLVTMLQTSCDISERNVSVIFDSAWHLRGLTYIKFLVNLHALAYSMNEAETVSRLHYIHNQPPINIQVLT